MKIIKISLLIIVALHFPKSLCLAQTLNWASLRQEQRHIVNVNAGYDYAFTYGVGYGYHLKMKLPIVLNVEYSQPAGDKAFDDFKTKIGGQIQLYQVNDFRFTAKILGIARRYENDYTRLFNFGSDMSAIAGYYRDKWFVAGEFGFDKAIVTNFKHTDLFRENFPDVKDGWYEPSTGGNFYYGLQAGVSFTNNDIFLKAGKVVQQDFETNPTIPFYVQIGYNRRF